MPTENNKTKLDDTKIPLHNSPTHTTTSTTTKKKDKNNKKGHTTQPKFFVQSNATQKHVSQSPNTKYKQSRSIINES